jgi:peptide-methionine (S)-S-oxide reductase
MGLFGNMLFGKKSEMIAEKDALPGRAQPITVAPSHLVNGSSMYPPFPEGCELAMFGLGCFWGAERLFWNLSGVINTAVGYAGGFTPNPTYEEVCTGRTGHTEVVRVVFAPAQISYEQLLAAFWEQHDPTQGMRQGNDVGTQYRSAIYCFDDTQYAQAIASRDLYQSGLTRGGYGAITTEIIAAPQFFYAEDYHQQYLAKNPGGYCGLAGTGVRCVGMKPAD